jgi:hypothetical protein
MLQLNTPIMIRGYTDYILELEKNNELELSILDNSDYISLYLLKIINNDLIKDNHLKDDLIMLQNNYNYVTK